MLLELGADPNRPNNSGDTPLHRVAATEHDESLAATEAARSLIHYGANLNCLNNDKKSPLDVAYEKKNENIFRLLRQAGARFAAVEPTELALAVLEGKVKTLEAFFSREASVDVNMRDVNGNTALHIAASTGNLKIAEYVLANGADAHARNTVGVGTKSASPFCGPMPLHLAAERLNAEIAHLLIENGADINAPYYVNEEFDGSPLITALWATHKNNRKKAHKVLRVLLEHGASLYAPPGSSSQSALSMAAWIKDKEEVALLLEYGAGRNAEEIMEAMRSAIIDNGSSNLAILWQAGRNFTPTLKLIDVLPHIGRAFLCLLTDVPNLETNEIDENSGETPLLWAIRQTGICFPSETEYPIETRDIKRLLKHGADPNLRDHAGNSPLSVARERNLPEVVALLEQYGAIA